jgi:hypothetical protein
MERETEEAPFAARDSLRADIEKNGRHGIAGLENFDSPSLLHDEEPVRIVSRVPHENRARET